MGNYVTLAVAISTGFIGVITCIIAYSQMKIASAKTKLDLYERRLNVYISALNCFQECYRGRPEELLQFQLDLIKSCAESRFLFKESSGIYEILTDMKKNSDQVHKFVCYRSNPEQSINTIAGQKEFIDLTEKHLNAREKFGENLATLEEKIKPYIQFENVKGWTFF